MFRWSSPQPIPPPLARLMEEAGCCRCDLGETADLTLFLPPHLLVSAGIGHVDILGQAYAGLDRPGQHGRLVNGERLLGLRPAELARWLDSDALERPLALATVEPLLAAVTLALLAKLPQLETRYQNLDAGSLRGGAPADRDYHQRLIPSNTELLAAWNTVAGQQGSPHAMELRELARDLERQLISTQEARAQTAALRRSARSLQDQLNQGNKLLGKLMILLSRTRQQAMPSSEGPTES